MNKKINRIFAPNLKNIINYDINYKGKLKLTKTVKDYKNQKGALFKGKFLISLNSNVGIFEKQLHMI